MIKLEQILQQILTKLDHMNEKMATKDELNEIKQTMATKDELNEIRQTMATKVELNEIKQTMATKDELNEIKQTMATKVEMNELRYTMDKGFENVNRKLNIISEQVAFNAEQNSRINHLEMEVQVIKKAIANL